MKNSKNIGSFFGKSEDKPYDSSDKLDELFVEFKTNEEKNSDLTERLNSINNSISLKENAITRNITSRKNIVDEISALDLVHLF